jgi:hypothetical protein
MVDDARQGAVEPQLHARGRADGDRALRTTFTLREGAPQRIWN